MATINHIRNTINQLKSSEGVIVSEHGSKEGILWSSFKKRLGECHNPNMLFNLEELVNISDNLEWTGDPVSV